MRKTRKTQKMMYIFFSVFLFAGIGMITGAIITLMSSLNYRKSAVEISGKISRVETYYDNGGDRHGSVYVDYEYNGVKYEDVRISSYSSSMVEGKKVTLYCNPDDPWDVRVKSMFYFAPILLSGMGIVFALVGAIPLIFMLKGAREQKRLKEQGRSIYATVEEISYNANVKVNGRHPFVIYCMYKDDYKDLSYRFKSQNLWSDPSAVFPVGSVIEVKVDENDYSKYYVNVEEMDRKIVDYT